MSTITLTVSRNAEEQQTQSFDAAKINNVSSLTGDDEQEGTQLWMDGSCERYVCIEPARKVRRMIDDALSREEIELGAEAVDLLVRAVQSPDGAIHFNQTAGALSIAVGDYLFEPLRGTIRRQYEYARETLFHQGFIDPKGGGLYHVTERGYVMGETLAKQPRGGPFCGRIRLPARAAGGEHPTPASITQNTFHLDQSEHHHQTSNSGNNDAAAAETANSMQTAADGKTVKVTDKENHSSWLLGKIVAGLKWIAGWFRG